MPPAVPFSTYGQAMLEKSVVGLGQVTLEWVEVDEATHFSVQVTRTVDGITYIDVPHTRMPIARALVRTSKDRTTRQYTVTDLTGDIEYTLVVNLYTAETGGDESTSEPEVVTPVALVIEDVAPSFTQSSDNPGDSANYTVIFQMTTVENTRLDDLIIEFHGDYGVPSSISNTSVAITTQLGDSDAVTFTPELVTVDGEKVILSLGDMDEDDSSVSGGTDYQLDIGEVVTVHFRQSSGITIPTEAKGYNLAEIEFGETGYKFEEERFEAEYGKMSPTTPGSRLASTAKYPSVKRTAAWATPLTRPARVSRTEPP